MTFPPGSGSCHIASPRHLFVSPFDPRIVTGMHKVAPDLMCVPSFNSGVLFLRRSPIIR